MDFVWLTGGDPTVVHDSQIAASGSGEIHKVSKVEKTEGSYSALGSGLRGSVHSGHGDRSLPGKSSVCSEPLLKIHFNRKSTPLTS